MPAGISGRVLEEAAEVFPKAQNALVEQCGKLCGTAGVRRFRLPNVGGTADCDIR